MPDKQKVLLSIDEVVEITGIGRAKIQEQIDCGKLKHFSLFGYAPKKNTFSRLAGMDRTEYNQTY